MTTWYDRLKEVIGEKGYDPSMRRSVQSVIMYEASRCIKPKVDSMRPFQRKIAFFDQAAALLQTCDFIPQQFRNEVMWRTGTSREPMTADIAWKRSRLIERELVKLAEKAAPFTDGVRSHQEVCDCVVQQMYSDYTKTQVKNDKNAGDSEEVRPGPVPSNWEHAHNNVMMVYRLYYNGNQLDPDFPPPAPPVPIVVPTERPAANATSTSPQNGFLYSGPPAPSSSMVPCAPQIPPPPMGFNSPAYDRQRILDEVKNHLELLKEFEGVIPDEEIKKRKRDLFLALPPAPPPANGDAKKAKL